MDQDIAGLLRRCAEALERIAPPPAAVPDLSLADAFVWQASRQVLQPVHHIARTDAALLCGIDRQKDILFANTERFARGFSANNAVLWGARGMGKSSLVKAAHAAANQVLPGSLALIEIHRDDLRTLGALLDQLRGQPRRVILFCDDLSFGAEDADYKALKSTLDGGIAGPPPQVLVYATSNRRHLMPRDMIENERATAIHETEAAEEKVSLSDRFGLWLGFHACDQAGFLAMVRAHAAAHRVPLTDETLVRRANEWALARGARSGRVAAQFVAGL